MQKLGVTCDSAGRSHMWFKAWVKQAGLLPARKRLEMYPPFRSMGIQVIELADDWSRALIRLPLNGHNRNPGGGMFGGSMASLADPIAALACAKAFPGYSVWTRQLNLDFLHEGRSDLDLLFEFAPQQRVDINEELQRTGRASPQFEYGFYRPDGRLCARVINQVAIRPVNHRPSGGALGNKMK